MKVKSKFKRHYKKFFGNEDYFKWYRENKNKYMILSEDVEGYIIKVYYIEKERKKKNVL